MGPLYMQDNTKVIAQIEPQTWVLPRSVDSYKALYRQATQACVEKGMKPMDSLIIAACVLQSIGIHVSGALDKAKGEDN